MDLDWAGAGLEKIVDRFKKKGWTTIKLSRLGIVKRLPLPKQERITCEIGTMVDVRHEKRRPLEFLLPDVQVQNIAQIPSGLW